MTWHVLTHWGRMTHICVGKLTIIGSDNGLSPERRQAIIWTNAEILLIGPLGTTFSEILIEIQTFSLKKIRLKMSSAKCCSFRLGLNELINHLTLMMGISVTWKDSLYTETLGADSIKRSHLSRKYHCGDETILQPTVLSPQWDFLYW